MSHTIIWEGPAYPEHESIIQKEIDELLANSLACAPDLVFHSIWLNDGDPDGPTIFLSGKEGGDADTYYAEYVGEPHWITVESENAGPAPDVLE